MMTRKVGRLTIVLGVAAMLFSRAQSAPLTFDNADALKQLTVSGDVSVDTSKDRGGVKGLETAGAARAGQRKGGSLRVGPGGKAVWPLRKRTEQECLNCGSTRMPRNPRSPGTMGPGPCGG